MMTVVIAGVGYVGTRLAEQLTDAGHHVFGVRRSAVNHPAYQSIPADLSQLDSLRGKLPANTSHLVFAAGPSESSEQAYRELYVHGLSNLLTLSSELAQLRRILFVSSTSVYAQIDGEWVDETSATHPTHFSGQCLLEAEALLSGTVGHSSQLTSVVLRCAGIYGPGRTRMLESVRAGQVSFDPAAPQYMNRIHRDDVAGALFHLLDEATEPGIYLGVDEYASPDAEVYTWLSSALGVAPPTPKLAQQERMRRGASNKRASSSKLRAAGYTFRFPTFREGYGAMLRAD